MLGAEQSGQHDGLRMSGVLVLVEQHRAEPLPLDARHVGQLGQPRCQDHLVGEIDGRHALLAGRVFAHQRQQRTAVPQRLQ
jgi:hypothetical protein